MIVIGGDDNYKNEDEEDREFISRWARRKISSQFCEEFLDGRKSFVFSWDKRHRLIHEKALLHFFDPRKKGQKFEYHPSQRQVQRAGPQRAIGSTMVPNLMNSPQEKLSSMKGTQIPPRKKGPEFSTRGTGRPGIQSQGVRPKETTSFTKQPQETNGG